MDELRARHEPLTFDATYCEACGQSYPCDFVRADDERRRLLAVVEAAQVVSHDAEPDIAYEGEGFVDYLVGHEAINALRAALDEVKP